MKDDECEGVTEPGGDPAGTNDTESADRESATGPPDRGEGPVPPGDRGDAGSEGREAEFAVHAGSHASQDDSDASAGDGDTGRTDGGAARTGGSTTRTDGGTATDGGVATRGDRTEYLEAEVNIFDPSTPFMRDHLRIIWTGFAIWAVIVFGPVTLTAIFPDLMTTQMPVIEFPLHYFLVAIGAPTGAFLLSFWYARKRDALDAEYGVDHDAVAGGPGGGPGEPGGSPGDAGAVAGGESGSSDPASGPGRAERRSDGGEDR